VESGVKNLGSDHFWKIPEQVRHVQNDSFCKGAKQPLIVTKLPKQIVAGA